MFGSKTLCVLLTLLTLFFAYMAVVNLLMGNWFWVLVDIVIGLLMADSAHKYYQQTPWTFLNGIERWVRNLRK